MRIVICQGKCCRKQVWICFRLRKSGISQKNQDNCNIVIAHGWGIIIYTNIRKIRANVKTIYKGYITKEIKTLNNGLHSILQYKFIIDKQ